MPWKRAIPASPKELDPAGMDTRAIIVPKMGQANTRDRKSLILILKLNNEYTNIVQWTVINIIYFIIIKNCTLNIETKK